MERQKGISWYLRLEKVKRDKEARKVTQSHSNFFLPKPSLHIVWLHPFDCAEVQQVLAWLLAGVLSCGMTRIFWNTNLSPPLETVSYRTEFSSLHARLLIANAVNIIADQDSSGCNVSDVTSSRTNASSNPSCLRERCI